MLDRGLAIMVSIVVGLILLFVSGSVGYFVAGGMAQGEFCEDCQEFMHTSRLNCITLGGARAMAKALAEGAHPLGAAVLEVAADPNGSGWLMLTKCPRCGKGYINLRMNFRGSYKDPQGNPQVMTGGFWLAASSALSPEHVTLFEPHIERIGATGVKSGLRS